MKIHSWAAAALLILASGCSFCESSTQLVAINVRPKDATVLVNGLAYSGSPMFVEAKRSKELMLLIYKPGYESVSYVVGNHLSTTGVLDACGTIFIFPFFGLMSNGAWALDETNLSFVLKPAMAEEEEAGNEDETQPAAIADSGTSAPATESEQAPAVDEQPAIEAATAAEEKQEAPAAAPADASAPELSNPMVDEAPAA